ncbi:MAG: bifunctional nuclease family protein [Candidatus Hydrothermarchaeota archaeon]|nr:MAG: bifunctional nuclease family protein [Candidatus Hydrothermarchaeota archaeon]
MEKEKYQKVKVAGVYMAETVEGVTPIVFLENEEKKVLPIYIGAAEAFSIQTALDKVPYPRPLTHDLLVSILEGFESEIEKIVIDDLNEGIFFARIIIRKNGDIYEFDARPSDSIALAVRTKAPVYVAKKVMDSASVDKRTYKIL